MAVTADGRLAVSASWDKTLKVWDLESGRVLATFSGETMMLTCAFASENRILVGDYAGKVYDLILEDPA